MKICIKCIAVIFFCLVISSARSNNVKQKVIIDTDAGADDAAAILLTLKSKPKEFEVIAITCSYGNTYVDNVVENVLKILTVANRSIPVYKGAQKALLKEYKPSNFFGSDGLGDFNFTEKIIAKLDKTKHAPVALVDLVNQYPGQITILSIGPTTNIATAIALDPLFLRHLKNYIILGSSVTGIGNVSPNVEFNFYQDPESNYIVLNNNNTISTLFPWETVIHSVSLDWRVNTLGKINSTIVNFLNNAERKTIPKQNEWHPADAMAAAVMIWPELIKTFIITNVSPVVDGMARGTVLVDYTNITGKPKNVKIVQAINVTAFQEILLEAFS